MKPLSVIVFASLFVHAVFGGCIATLYTNDPLLNAIGLHNNTAATTWNKWAVYNAGDDLDWNTYAVGNFTIAPEGGRLGAFVDLGTESDLSALYKLSVPRGDIYISIHYEGNQLVLTSADAYSGNFIPFQAAQIQPLQNPSVTNSFQPIVGNIFLVKITDQYDANYLRVVKLIVLDKTINTVTIRWDVLQDSVPYSACMVSASAPVSNPAVNPSPAEDSVTKTPGWVAGTVATLFIVNAGLVLAVTFLFIRSRHSHYTGLN